MWNLNVIEKKNASNNNNVRRDFFADPNCVFVLLNVLFWTKRTIVSDRNLVSSQSTSILSKRRQLKKKIRKNCVFLMRKKSEQIKLNAKKQSRHCSVWLWVAFHLVETAWISDIRKKPTKLWKLHFVGVSNEQKAPTTKTKKTQISKRIPRNQKIKERRFSSHLLKSTKTQ